MNVLITDGETCETPRNEQGQLDVKNGQVYDLGGGVLNLEQGKIIKEFSIINEDVFFGMPDSMREAYYADKIPQYLQEMREGKRTIMNTWQLWDYFYHICQAYDVKAIVGHNVWFDVNTLNATMRYQTKSRRRYFLPYGIQIMDTMRMAEKVIANTREYIDFCVTNNYMTNHSKPRPRLTAEILWRFLTNDNNFQEEHTGLEDVKIEAQIFLECLRRGYPLPFYFNKLDITNNGPASTNLTNL